jgi:DNA-binding NarL/FixJ family response regulator
MQGSNNSEDRVRDVLAGLRQVLDTDDPLSALATPDARAVVADAWDALADALSHSSEHTTAQMLHALHELRRIDGLLLHTREVAHADIGRRLGQVLARLEAAPCSVHELVAMAPGLVTELGFDRAIISRVSNGLWVSQAVFITDDPEWAEQINRVGQEQPQQLVPGLFETEVVRRRQPVLVHDVQHEPRTHRPIAKESRSTSYVAAPIVSGNRVIGLLHGDRYLQGVDTDLLDRQALQSFSEALRLALSRAQLAAQLDNAGTALKQAAIDAARAVTGIHEVRIDLPASPIPQTMSDSAPAPHTPQRIPASVRDRLTRRETQVLELLAQGRTNSSIAGELVISEETVKQHVKNLLRKLGAANRAEAVARLFGSEDL